MDYFKLIHITYKKDAELTIATIKYDVDQARRFGVLATDENQQIVDFQENQEFQLKFQTNLVIVM